MRALMIVMAALFALAMGCGGAKAPEPAAPETPAAETPETPETPAAEAPAGEEAPTE